MLKKAEFGAKSTVSVETIVSSEPTTNILAYNGGINSQVQPADLHDLIAQRVASESDDDVATLKSRFKVLTDGSKVYALLQCDSVELAQQIMHVMVSRCFFSSFASHRKFTGSC